MRCNVLLQPLRATSFPGSLMAARITTSSRVSSCAPLKHGTVSASCNSRSPTEQAGRRALLPDTCFNLPQIVQARHLEAPAQADKGVGVFLELTKEGMIVTGKEEIRPNCHEQLVAQLILSLGTQITVTI